MPFDSAEVRRLHPTSFLFLILRELRQWLLPLAGAVLFTGVSSWLMVGAAMAIGMGAVGALFRYATYRYRFAGEELVVRRGVVFRSERHIPYGRIQNVNLIRNPLHRALDVAEVHLETAGGARPEAILRVLGMTAVDELRARVFRGREAGAGEGAAAGADAGGRVLVDLPGREVALFGLISNKGMVVVAAAFGAVWQFGLEDRIESVIAYAREHASDLRFPMLGPATAFVLGVLGLVAALVALRVLSALWGLVKFWRFRLTRRGEDLRAEYGLLTRVTATVPRGRIQLLNTRRHWLHCVLGRVAVAAETAGSVPGEERGSAVAAHVWLAPVLRDEQLPGLLAELLPEAALEPPEWRPLSPRAGRRLARRGIVLAALATAAAIPVARFGAIAVAAAGASVALLHARWFPRYAAFALTSEAVLWKSGWWVRRASIVRYSKIQAVTLGESPFDRRSRMARIAVDTAGAGKAGHRVHIPYLDREVADALFARLAAEAGRREFRW